MAGTGDIIMPGRILESIGDKKIGAQILYIEWGVSGWKRRIGKRPGKSSRRKTTVKDVNGPAKKISGIEKVRRAVISQSQPLING
jgi:hypothetical protein